MSVERRAEDRRVEPRITRIDDRVDPMTAGELGHALPVARIDRRGREPIVAEPGDGSLGSRRVEISEDESVEERAATRHRRDRCPHAAGAHDEDLHPRTLGRPSGWAG